MRVYLLACSAPAVDYDAFLAQEASGHTPATASFPDALCEQAGRVCYDSFANPRPGGNPAYLANIKAGGHGEVLEHATFTFFVADLSRGCMGQLTRYRAGWSFCVRSSRYCDESLQPLLLPPNADLPDDLLADIEAHHDATIALYARIQRATSGSRKAANQAARYVLPEGRACALTFTANARALRHAIEQRCSPHADVEIRLLFNKVLDKLQHAAPALFNDYVRTPQEDGTCIVTTSHRKV